MAVQDRRIAGVEDSPADRHTEEVVEEDSAGNHTGPEELEEEEAGSLAVEKTGTAMHVASRHHSQFLNHYQ